jgi:hypothetical protein
MAQGVQDRGRGAGVRSGMPRAVRGVPGPSNRPNPFVTPPRPGNPGRGGAGVVSETPFRWLFLFNVKNEW